MRSITRVVALLFLVYLGFVESEPYDNCKIEGRIWPKYNGFCYFVGIAEKYKKLSYYDAEDYCRSFGGHLVSIHSDDENEFLMQKMDEWRRGGRVWIGLNLFDGEDSPKWSDDSNASYLKILKKQFPKREKCFMLYLSERGWRPEHCALRYPAICKVKDGITPVTLVPPTLPPTIGYCPDGWIQLGQKCYKYFGAKEEDRLKYSEARNACWDLGKEYSLVSIHSMEEQAFLTQHLSGLNSSAWIGINKVESDEIGHDIVFGWVDNSRNDFEYWTKGHPPPGTWKYCGRLAYDSINKGEWIADYCDVSKRGYICQRPSDPNMPLPTPEPSKCKEGFEEYRNSCYKYFSEPQIQNKSEEACRNLGGHLVSIVDALEQAFLYNLVRTKANQVRIGLVKQQGTLYAQWTDKQPMYYTNWTEEDFPFSREENICAVMDSSGYKWKKADCSDPKPYVCKITTDLPPKFPVKRGYCSTDKAHVFDIGDEYCYHYPEASSDRFTSWDTTSRYCMSRGMKMISLHSEHQSKSLMAYLWRQSGSAHLGLIRTFDKKSFMWIDGSPLNYTNWADREPNNSWKSTVNCAAFSLINGEWSSTNCAEGGLTLCRLEKN